MYQGLTIPARERPSWECIDLGIASARQHYWVLLFLFLLPCSIIALSSYWAFPGQRSWLPILLAWWFKPLYERPILYYLSRTMFGEDMSIKKVVKAFPSLLKPGLIARLTYARLSPGRSFYMPLFVLEKQTGAAYRQRRDLLNYNQSAHTWLTILGIHIEYVLQFSAFLLIFYFTPESIYIGNPFDFMSNEYGAVINQLLLVIAMAIFAPFYVAAGFMLYLNRRIKLEGWDIEINFHNIVNRLHKERVRSSAKPQSSSQTNGLKTLSMFAGILVVLLCSFNPQKTSLYAEQEPDTIAAEQHELINKAEAYERIYQISESEQVVEKETKTGWRFIQKESAVKESNSWFKTSWLEGLSKVLRFIAIVFIVSILIYLIYFYRDIFTRFSRKKEVVFASQTELTPIAKRLKDVPDDFIAAAEKAWENGDRRAALSFLYRGSLVTLVKKGCKDILAASTENECLKGIRSFHSGEFYANMRLITRSWQQIAYAQRTTSEELFQSLIKTIQTDILPQAGDDDINKAAGLLA